jgi:hypothetical protein
MDQFDASELSRSAFCRQHSISLATFDRWRQRLQPESAATNEKEAAIFVELADAGDAETSPESTAGVSASAWEIELQISEGMVLRLRKPC